MSTTEVTLQGLGQAGKPYMQLVDVRWDSAYFKSGLRTTPTPLLLPVMGVVQAHSMEHGSAAPHAHTTIWSRAYFVHQKPIGGQQLLNVQAGD